MVDATGPTEWIIGDESIAYNICDSSLAMKRKEVTLDYDCFNHHLNEKTM